MKFDVDYILKNEIERYKKEVSDLQSELVRIENLNKKMNIELINSIERERELLNFINAKEKGTDRDNNLNAKIIKHKYIYTLINE